MTRQKGHYPCERENFPNFDGLDYSPNLAEKVDQIASRLERSRGWIMKQALSDWIDQEEERNRLTREALADVDAGRVIDHQAVQAWADSLSTEDPLPVPR